MVAPILRQRLNLQPVPVAAAGVGVLVALCVLFAPTALLESMVMDSGVAALIPSAEPPLGMTARLLLTILAGVSAALFAWAALLMLVGDGMPVRRRTVRVVGSDDAMVTIRRADAHPDAPPRPPVLAMRDLGKPFLDVRAPIEPVEMDLPKDLSQPLAAFDPSAIPIRPVAAPQPVPPLRRAKPEAPVVEEAVEVAAETVSLPEPEPEQAAEPEPAPILPPEAPVLPTDHYAPISPPRMAPPIPSFDQPEPPLPPVPEVEPEPDAIIRPGSDPSINALLERLERGVERREQAREQRKQDLQHGLEDTLETLRKLAMR